MPQKACACRFLAPDLFPMMDFQCIVLHWAAILEIDRALLPHVKANLTNGDLTTSGGIIKRQQERFTKQRFKMKAKARRCTQCGYLFNKQNCSYSRNSGSSALDFILQIYSQKAVRTGVLRYAHIPQNTPLFFRRNPRHQVVFLFFLFVFVGFFLSFSGYFYSCTTTILCLQVFLYHSKS